MVLILFLFAVCVSVYGSSEKRLLLTDPDVINGRLSKLERSMAQVLKEKSQQDVKIRTLEATIATLQQYSTYIVQINF